MIQYIFTYACTPKCLCMYSNCKNRALPCDFFTKTPAFIFRIHIFLNAIVLGLLPALMLICTPLPDGFKVINSYHLAINVFMYVFIHALIRNCTPLLDSSKVIDSYHEFNVFIYVFIYALVRICTPLPDGFKINDSCDLIIYSSDLFIYFGVFLKMHCYIVCVCVCLCDRVCVCLCVYV